MREKIIDEMKYWGEEEDYTQENLDTYESFTRAIDEIANMSNLEDFNKYQIIEMLKEELESLEGVLK